jgi:hypothetical protein
MSEHPDGQPPAPEESASSRVRVCGCMCSYYSCAPPTPNPQAYSTIPRRMLCIWTLPNSIWNLCSQSEGALGSCSSRR